MQIAIKRKDEMSYLSGMQVVTKLSIVELANKVEQGKHELFDITTLIDIIIPLVYCVASS